ncbi:MAG: lyase family protein, partial [Aurantimonas coralicida]
MPSIVVKSSIYGDMFGTADMRGLFEDDTMLGLYLDVETALARAQTKLGLIPEAAAKAITEAADTDKIDMDKLSARTQIVGYPILPLVEQLSDWAPDGLGQYCHWGATTQDIMDTADVLQVRAGLDIVEEYLERIAAALAKLAQEYADTPMAGRTHLQHALPVSFGFKAATWLSAIDRHRTRLAELRGRVEVVQFSGAAGTLASLSGNGLATQAALAEELGLAVP